MKVANQVVRKYWLLLGFYACEVRVLGWFCVYLGGSFCVGSLSKVPQEIGVQIPHKLIHFKSLNISIFA
jgi:hypothetical protein